MTKKSVKHYGSVSGVTDIRSINQKIRSQIRNVPEVAGGIGKSKRAALTELVKRSMYLVTLTHGSPWKKAFHGKIIKMRNAAKDEYAKTARTANRQVKKGTVSGNFYDESYGNGRTVTVESKPKGV